MHKHWTQIMDPDTYVEDIAEKVAEEVSNRLGLDMKQGDWVSHSCEQSTSFEDRFYLETSLSKRVKRPLEGSSNSDTAKVLEKMLEMEKKIDEKSFEDAKTQVRRHVENNTPGIRQEELERILGDLTREELKRTLGHVYESYLDGIKHFAQRDGMAIKVSLLAKGESEDVSDLGLNDWADGQEWMIGFDLEFAFPDGEKIKISGQEWAPVFEYQDEKVIARRFVGNFGI